MSPNETDNVINFQEATRDGSSMPFDRSGQPSRQQLRAKTRADEKAARAQIEEQKKLRRMLEAPVTKQEFQRAIYQVFGSMEKVVAEFRKLAIMNEALRKLLHDQGTITREDYEKYANLQHMWNSEIDRVMQAYEQNIPLNQIVKIVADWNNANDQKIEWQHIDLAARLIADENSTLEEKLLIASEMEMPEAFIDDLRKREVGDFAADAADLFAANIEDALASSQAGKNLPFYSAADYEQVETGEESIPVEPGDVAPPVGEDPPGDTLPVEPPVEQPESTE